MPTKIRVMPTLLFKNVGLVKGVGFDSWRRVGSAMQAVKVYNLREVDELIFLDITATAEGRRPDFEAIDELADECFMPLTVGGGVRTIEDVRRLLQVGADKVAVNTAALESPGLIGEVARRFGSQCVVVSIDVRRTPAGNEVFAQAGTRPTGRDPVAWAKEAVERGAGEILLTSVERDGTMAGYDVPLTRAVSEAVDVPVIASGGAGSYEHMAEVLEQGGASAVAAASLFHFTEQTPLGAKRYLEARGFPVRLSQRQAA
jgi:cyclase